MALLGPTPIRDQMNRTYGAVAAVLLVLGVALTGGGLYFSLQEDAALSGGVETNGTVVASGVEPADDGYVPNVTYRYTADGRTYTSRNIYPPTLGVQPGARSWAEDVAAEYEPGDRVNVTYSPSDPGQSYIRERRNPTPIMAFGLGMVVLAFAFLIGVAARQEDRDVVQDEAGQVAQPARDDPDTED